MVGIVQSGSSAGAYAVVSLALVYVGVAFYCGAPRTQAVAGTRYVGLDPNSAGAVGDRLHDPAGLLSPDRIDRYPRPVRGLVAGVIMPEKGAFKTKLIASVEDVKTILLPVFFAFTGLRTEVGLLNDVHSWLICGAIVAVAVIGKMEAASSPRAGRDWAGASSGARRTDEHTWADGAHRAQYRLRYWCAYTQDIHNAGHHGNRYDHDDGRQFSFFSVSGAPVESLRGKVYTIVTPDPESKKRSRTCPPCKYVQSQR